MDWVRRVEFAARSARGPSGSSTSVWPWSRFFVLSKALVATLEDVFRSQDTAVIRYHRDSSGDCLRKWST